MLGTCEAIVLQQMHRLPLVLPVLASHSACTVSHSAHTMRYSAHTMSHSAHTLSHIAHSATHSAQCSHCESQAPLWQYSAVHEVCSHWALSAPGFRLVGHVLGTAVCCTGMFLTRLDASHCRPGGCLLLVWTHTICQHIHADTPYTKVHGCLLPASELSTIDRHVRYPGMQ